MIREAQTYPWQHREIVVKPNHEGSCFYWCRPKDGEPHGSQDGLYILFVDLDDAIETALRHGYAVRLVK